MPADERADSCPVSPDYDDESSDACRIAILRRFDELTQASFHVLAAESGLSADEVYQILVDAGAIGVEPEEGRMH